VIRSARNRIRIVLIGIAVVALAGLLGATKAPRLTRGLFTVDTRANPASLGYIEWPKRNASMSSVFVVEGWAADQDGVVEVRIYVDADRVAIAHPWLARPDVEAALPNVARQRHGFSVEVNAGSKIGPRVVRADVLDTRGAVTTVARATITIDP
jgi:hypothetical protein